MSTFTTERQKCAICGNLIENTLLCSTNEVGSKDLDLRPAPMHRDTMHTWVYHCPKCRFSSRKIEEADGASPDSIAAFYDYNKPLINAVSGNQQNTLAEYFLQVYFRRIKDDKFEEAADLALRAAWDCDDRENERGATACRNLAIDAMTLIELQSEVSIVVKADLLRRSGRFLELFKEYSNFHYDKNPFVNEIIAFQLEKARKADKGCYKLSDV